MTPGEPRVGESWANAVEAESAAMLAYQEWSARAPSGTQPWEDLTPRVRLAWQKKVAAERAGTITDDAP